MSTPANKLTADLLIEIPRKFPNIRVWRNNRVDAMVPGRGGKMRRVQAGVDGQADISGICCIRHPRLAPRKFGLRIELEIKVGRDRLSDKQEAFREMINEHGGIFLVASDVAATLQRIDNVVRTLEDRIE